LGDFQRTNIGSFKEKGHFSMVRKIVLIILLVIISQAPFAVYAGMHFPGTAAVDHSIFQGTAKVSGFGNSTDTSTVSARLLGNGLTALCSDSYGHIAYGKYPINIDQSSPELHPDRNGNAHFTFTIPLLPTPKESGCPKDKWQVVGLKGTLYPTYTAKQFKKNKPDKLFGLAKLAFRCDIDETVNPRTNCVELFETKETF
jgi:hypothetical protein